MKSVLAVLALVLLAACRSDGGGQAVDPADDPTTRDAEIPAGVPAAPGPVHSRDLATVMDTGRPELCLGPVAESWPPQCGGPAIVGWDWKGTARGMFEKQGDIRWGQFAVTGTWDGTEFTVTDAIPAASYDAMATEEPTYPQPGRENTEAELDGIAGEVGEELPGAQGAHAHDGHVLVDVIYDDGSLQAYADQRYGRDVVVVVPALVDGG